MTMLCLEAVFHGLEIGRRGVQILFLLWCSEGRRVSDKTCEDPKSK